MWQESRKSMRLCDALYDAYRQRPKTGDPQATRLARELGIQYNILAITYSVRCTRRRALEPNCVGLGALFLLKAILLGSSG